MLVTAKDGTLRVNENGKTVEVAQGKTIALQPKTARAPQTGGSQKLGGAPAWVDYTILGGCRRRSLVFAIAGYMKRAKGARSYRRRAPLSASLVAAYERRFGYISSSSFGRGSGIINCLGVRCNYGCGDG